MIFLGLAACNLDPEHEDVSGNLSSGLRQTFGSSRLDQEPYGPQVPQLNDQMTKFSSHQLPQPFQRFFNEVVLGNQLRHIKWKHCQRAKSSVSVSLVLQSSVTNLL